MSKSPDTEVLVIGAGPCALFQVFQLGLQGVSCTVLEALPHPGGQCAELYADKPIFDIPAIPTILAGDLTKKLLEQITPFDPTIHYGQTVKMVKANGECGYRITTDRGEIFTSKYVILAAGAGAFTTVKMRLDGIHRFEQTQLFYQDFPDSNSARQALNGKHLLVSGDTASAISTAITASAHATHTTYIHRKRRLAADDSMLAALDTAVKAGKLTVIHGKINDFITEDEKITHLSVVNSNKETLKLKADVIIAKLGNSPKLNKFEDWNLQTNRNHINVDPSNYQSNLNDFYAIGDINNYPGKRKLILCGFHEATLVAFDIASKLNPQKPIHTQYTTTSTELHKRLGVTPMQ